eukprot:CAMPEP_0179041410 /NCGR_PEP_ID=MMETSP0796-20121207/16142_1 /TAXON_ID=73915 /ORGANISM="Pyrodinium bahamense, Strain pbaha01" /LENGTH=921 /DNA_ID=CAMNT_0020737773 /DNA_START=33 /DNA_END=2798 /DNA_ORIENTATION=-
MTARTPKNRAAPLLSAIASCAIFARVLGNALAFVPAQGGKTRQAMTTGPSFRPGQRSVPSGIVPKIAEENFRVAMFGIGCLAILAVAKAASRRDGRRHDRGPQRKNTLALAGSGRPAAAARAEALVRRAVPLTGDTLGASLKMQCDTSGADYSIYWAAVDDTLVVAGKYISPDVDAAVSTMFLSKCENMKLGKDNTLAGMVYKTGLPEFLPDAPSSSKSSRTELYQQCGIKSICVIPFEDGVLEYGSLSRWQEEPECPTFPKDEMRTAFETHGATYMMWWTQRNGKYVVAADYVTPLRRAVLKNLRGDDETFASKCRDLELGDESSVGIVFKSKEELYFPDATSETARAKGFVRGELAKEFGVGSVHVVPAAGGVLEYGVPSGPQLRDNTLLATMKMQCKMANASYAIYWVEQGGAFAAGKTYITTEAKVALKEKRGDDDNFPLRCQSRVLKGNGAVGRVFESGVPDMLNVSGNCQDFSRTELAREFGIESIGFLPVPGGVLEYGSTEHWDELPKTPKLPRAEMARAFNEFGAVYVLYWTPEGNTWRATADFTTPEREIAIRRRRNDGFTFCMKCRERVLTQNSLVAQAAASGTELTCTDATTEESFERKDLAEEFTIKNIRFVPCEDGVLEYGLASTKSFGEGSVRELLFGFAGAAAFCAFVFATRGSVDAVTWLSCYVIEYSLSVDNLFVFIIIFKYFKVPPQLQTDVLNYGIYGAVVFRFIFVFLGAIVLQKFEFLILIFAAILIYASYQGLFGEEDEDEDDEDLENNAIVQNLKKVLDVTDKFDGDSFFTTIGDRTYVTPLFLCLLTIEISDIVFATDSVPAVLGTTKDSFIAYTSNVFAVYGLRALYFLLEDAISSFSKLETAVNLVLGFIGLKIVTDYFEIVQIDVAFSLLIVLGTLGTGVVLSIQEQQEQQAEK